MIGMGFMGRAHSQAWAGVNRFFDLPLKAVQQTVSGRDIKRGKAFAARWGWNDATIDLPRAIEDSAVDLVDIVTPNHLQAEQAIAALEAGKHVACEKPLAGILDDARQMMQAARQRKRRGVKT